ncbi:MAG: ParA family protein [Spirochaetota bacterium]|nr:ParA family protein [Spirochaetota bacterium]
MRIISISNNKGGVGKTTSTVNIAAGLQLQGKRVLVIDIDPQAQSTYHFGIKSKELKYSIFDVIKGDISFEETLIDRYGLHILPSCLELRGIEFLPIPAKEYLLKDSLEDLQGYDYVLIDCPPSLGTLTLNSLCYAKEIFIPVQLQFLPFHGMYNLFEAVQLVKKRLNKNIEVTGIIGTMYNARKIINREVIDEIKERFPGKLFDTVIRENVSLQEAPSWGQTIYEYKTDSNGAIDYMNLTREILKQQEKN